MTSIEDTRVNTRAGAKSHLHRSEIRDGMRIEWDVPIEMDDGLHLRADVFRPIKEGRYPAILSYGPLNIANSSVTACNPQQRPARAQR